MPAYGGAETLTHAGTYAPVPGGTYEPTHTATVELTPGGTEEFTTAPDGAGGWAGPTDAVVDVTPDMDVFMATVGFTTELI